MEIDIKRFQTVCEDNDIQYLTDYSGRGMLGKNCVGVTGSAYDLMRFTIHCIPKLDEDWWAETGDADTWVERIECSDEWYAVRTDSLGVDAIFYWPNIRTVKNEEEKDEDPNAGDARDADPERMP